jgi:hypothetical protein
MDNLPMAMIVSNNLQNTHARSALPDAPVIPVRPRRVRQPALATPRRALATVLDRAARAVAPSTPPCIPAP